MTRAQALKKGVALFGKNFWYRVSNQLSSPESRQRERDQLSALIAERKAIEADVKSRLQALPWYVESQARLAEIRKGYEQSLARQFYFRFTVGQVEHGMAFVKGEGDTWEDAFAAIKKD